MTLSGKTVRLCIWGDEASVFTLPLEVAQMSKTIKKMFDDLGEDSYLTTAVPLRNVKAPILSKVIEFCQHHIDNPLEDESKAQISEWDQNFCALEHQTLFELILVANYLDIKCLLDVTCKTVANMIKGKTPEEIRVTFNIKNDFTPEEEAKVYKENEWCEEK
jgi:S-phase kinase-associated protein 1